MKARYVSDSRARVRIFTNDVTILTHLHRRLVAEGFQQVSFIKFWVHVVTAYAIGGAITGYPRPILRVNTMILVWTYQNNGNTLNGPYWCAIRTPGC